jgi:hypothetical protein
MNRNLRSSIIGSCATVVLATAMAGCGASGTSQYVPDTDVARTSLEAALTAWRDGRPCGHIDAKPPIEVADSRWRGGQQIESFQIGEEQVDGQGPRQFMVKLTNKKGGKVEDVRYFVSGRDPVWVFAETDYQQMMDMGNGPDTNKSSKAGGKRRGR